MKLVKLLLGVFFLSQLPCLAQELRNLQVIKNQPARLASSKHLNNDARTLEPIKFEKLYRLIKSGLKKQDESDLTGAIADFRAALLISNDKAIHGKLGIALVKKEGATQEALDELRKGGINITRTGDFLDAGGKLLTKPHG